MGVLQVQGVTALHTAKLCRATIFVVAWGLSWSESAMSLQFWLLSKINRSSFLVLARYICFTRSFCSPFTCCLSFFCCPHSLWEVIHPIHPDTQSRPRSGFMPHCQRLPLTWSHPRMETTWHLWSNAWLSY